MWLWLCFSAVKGQHYSVSHLLFVSWPFFHPFKCLLSVLDTSKAIDHAQPGAGSYGCATQTAYSILWKSLSLQSSILWGGVGGKQVISVGKLSFAWLFLTAVLLLMCKRANSLFSWSFFLFNLSTSCDGGRWIPVLILCEGRKPRLNHHKTELPFIIDWLTQINSFIPSRIVLFQVGNTMLRKEKICDLGGCLEVWLGKKVCPVLVEVPDADLFEIEAYDKNYW